MTRGYGTWNLDCPPHYPFHSQELINFQMSPAGSPEILHRTMKNSALRGLLRWNQWVYYQFSLQLVELGSVRVNRRSKRKYELGQANAYKETPNMRLVSLTAVLGRPPITGATTLPSIMAIKHWLKPEKKLSKPELNHIALLPQSKSICSLGFLTLYLNATPIFQDFSHLHLYLNGNVQLFCSQVQFLCSSTPTRRGTNGRWWCEGSWGKQCEITAIVS